jgi:hypothetical protein
VVNFVCFEASISNGSVRINPIRSAEDIVPFGGNSNSPDLVWKVFQHGGCRV